MATFSPTLQFSKHWLATPNAVKQAFYQELDDIIHMLGSDIATKDYQFTNNDFGSAVSELLSTHQGEPREPAKLVHSIDTTPLTQETRSEMNPDELANIEARISTKLSVQLDDFLGEHMARLSDDLKAWVNTAIKNELAKYKSNHQN